MTIASHTIVKNGMPFIGKVLRQVAPYMDKMFIALSQYSNDGTREEIMKFIEENLCVVEFMEEGNTNPAELTKVRQFQVDRTTQDWILFLDDDDYWPKDQLELCLKELDKNPSILAYSVNPYQLIDFCNYDISWSKKFFSKFLKRDGLKYIGDWPKDLPTDKDGKPLYWKTHNQVKNIPYKFYHLSYLKNHSFRNENWAEQFKFKIGRIEKLKENIVL